MKIGIQYQRKLMLEVADEVGFSYVEMPYDLCGNHEVSAVSGIVLNIKNVTETIFLNAIKWVEKYGAEYLLIDTQDVFDDSLLREIIENTAQEIRQKAVPIYIENGYVQTNGVYGCCAFSEAEQLRQMAEDYNAICESDCFHTALNVGYANLLGKNLRLMVEELGETLQLLHANDNNGHQNVHQMPYTFATGRGTQPSTDWYRTIGSMVKQNFDGWVVFDVEGLIARAPKGLQKSMLQLLWSIAMAWRDEFKIRERLCQPGKQLILFGAGRMIQNYLENWGEEFPPAFLVDNNSEIWDENRLGYEVKSPNCLLEIPEEERNVWICNQYYDPIGEQLSRAGITYQCYWDHYYL